jgi:hypothetical protein
MDKNKAYNKLLEMVQQAGGFVSFKPSERPCVLLNGDGTKRHVLAAAVFESADESSPLKLITTRFSSWDVDDYLSAEDIECIVSRI